MPPRPAPSVSTRSLALVLRRGRGVDGACRGAARDDPPPTQVRDLDYGDVLFHFFQDDYFESIVRLEANRDFGRMAPHAGEAELLRRRPVPVARPAQRGRAGSSTGCWPDPWRLSVRDRARFYLAASATSAATTRRRCATCPASQPLVGSSNPSAQLLAANVLMSLGRSADAAAKLEDWNGHERLVDLRALQPRRRAGARRRARARPRLLDAGRRAGQRRTRSRLSLRDRANLALGFAMLQQAGSGAPRAGAEPRAAGRAVHQPGAAGARLGGDECQVGTSAALVPWLELQDRKLLDAAVQESYRRAVRLRQAGVERPGRAVLRSAR